MKTSRTKINGVMALGILAWLASSCSGQQQQGDDLEISEDGQYTEDFGYDDAAEGNGQSSYDDYGNDYDEGTQYSNTANINSEVANDTASGFYADNTGTLNATLTNGSNNTLFGAQGTATNSAYGTEGSAFGSNSSMSGSTAAYGNTATVADTSSAASTASYGDAAAMAAVPVSDAAPIPGGRVRYVREGGAQVMNAPGGSVVLTLQQGQHPLTWDEGGWLKIANGMYVPYDSMSDQGIGPLRYPPAWR